MPWMPFTPPPPVYPPRSGNARTDAELIRSVLLATIDWQRTRDQELVISPLRELIWCVWEIPRLREIAATPGKRLVDRKYPSWVPWSPSARAAYEEHGEKCRISLEHVMPAYIVVKELLRKPPATNAV